MSMFNLFKPKRNGLPDLKIEKRTICKWFQVVRAHVWLLALLFGYDLKAQPRTPSQHTMAFIEERIKVLSCERGSGAGVIGASGRLLTVSHNLRACPDEIVVSKVVFNPESLSFDLLADSVLRTSSFETRGRVALSQKKWPRPQEGIRAIDPEKDFCISLLPNGAPLVSDLTAKALVEGLLALSQVMRASS